MDLHTSTMFRLIKSAAGKFHAIKTEQIPPPHTEADPAFPVMPVPLVGNGSLIIPDRDDDIPTRPWFVRMFLDATNRFAPMGDDATTWKSSADARQSIEGLFGKLLPTPDPEWPSLSDDQAMTHWAFQGFGAQRLEAVRPGQDGLPGEAFVVRHNKMYQFDVRPGLARYGGDLFLDAQGKPMRIRLGDKDVKPGDGQAWEVAKFTFRTSSLVWVTLADHVGRCHYGTANALFLGARRQLPLGHPLRSFLSPFFYRTAAINNGSTQTLVPERALLHRTSGFTWASMQAIYKALPSEFHYESFPEELRRKGVHPESLPEGGLSLYPFGADGLLFWNAVRAFVVDAFERSPALGGVLKTTSPQTQQWWDDMSKLLPAPLPALSADAILDWITYAIFTVTGFHNHVGTVAAYVRDPAAAGGKVWPDAIQSDCQSSLQLCLVACITGFPLPLLAGDFGHLMPDDASRAAAGRFREKLTDIEAEVERRNARRSLAFRSFSPRRMATSVGI